jgi:exo-beta-1,3-glucanase (GH17 family)
MKDYSVIRIYGMDCKMIERAVENVVKNGNGQKLMVGAYLTGQKGSGETLSEVITTLKKAIDQHASGDWSVVALFNVENERVNEKAMTASAVVDAIDAARKQLRDLGYKGLVGAVETVPATVDNPTICKNSDVVMVNCHAFFDGNTEAANAGTFVKSQVELVKKACPNKRVIVTESGWPHQGSANNMAVPSPENQKMALESIRANFDHDMFLFHAFDSGWKAADARTFNAEPFWGIMGQNN